MVIKRRTADASPTHGEPTAAELGAIEAEWPSIAEDLARLDQEIVALTSQARVSELDVRRVRRARRAVLRPVPLVLVRRVPAGGEAA